MLRCCGIGGWVFVAALGCQEEEAGPELVVWHGQHVTYENDASLRVCGGTRTWVDDFAPFVARELGIEVPPMQVYQWLLEDDLPCRDGVLGCANGDVGSAQKPFLLHEVVHATMYASGYPYQPFFGEGLAYALDPWTGDGMGPRYLLHWKGTDRLVDPRPSMTLDPDDLNYSTAGSFVGFLLARHGPAPFLEFMRALGTSRDIKVIEAKFVASYGIPLDSEAELFMTGAACTPESFGPGLYDCTAEEVAWEDDSYKKRWVVTGGMDCASGEVVGGHGASGVRSVTLEVPTTGRYLIQGFGDGALRMVIGPCASCPWERRDRGGKLPYSGFVDLEAGTHFVRVQGRASESANFEVSVLGPAP